MDIKLRWLKLIMFWVLVINVTEYNLVNLARDEDRGRAAVVELEKEGLHPKFHRLDVDDQGSIERLKKFLSDNYGGLDLLVNNAGIGYKVSI